MPITPLGEQRLRELLDGGGHVVLANRVRTAGDTRILSAAIVRHFAGGETENSAAFDLDIGPGESLTFDPDRLHDSPMIGAEAILRVLADDGEHVAEAYAVAQTLEVTGFRAAEFGVMDRPSVFGNGESAVPDVPSIAVYAKPA